MKLIVLACLLAYVAAVSTQQDCLSSGLVCPRIGRCLNYSQLCDGVNDCRRPMGRNSSVDEGCCGIDCVARVFKCNPPSGLRVSLAALCNGVDDCPTGEDEEQHEGQAEGLDEGTALCSGPAPDQSSSSDVPTPSPTSLPPSDQSSSSDVPTAAIAGGAVGAVVVMVLVGLALLVVLACIRRRRTAAKRAMESMEMDKTGSQPAPESPYSPFDGVPWMRRSSREALNEYREKLPSDLLIPMSQLKLTNCIGQGEFGIVYKAHMTGRASPMPLMAAGDGTSVIVAVKTLKGFYDQSQVNELMRESIKMSDFDHPNVLALIGVCVDGGPAPYIVTPFMANGSLLAYLRENRSELIPENDVGEEQVSAVSKRLIEMCYQISKGMEYLAHKRFVHRDLAARNCMIDSNFMIKVADFGLSESVYTKTCFMETGGSCVKLPVKWMSLESLTDGVFTEKADVWSYGVTCWEVFNGGKTPYPGVDPLCLAGLLDSGYRMERPQNAACSDEMNSIIVGCWAKDPGERPSFSDVVCCLSEMLTVMSDYMELSTVSTFGGWQGNSPEDTRVGATGEPKTDSSEKPIVHSEQNSNSPAEVDGTATLDTELEVP